MRALQLHDKPIRGLAFTPDGLSIVTATRRSVLVWDLAADRERFEWTDHDAIGIAVAPDGRWLACGGDGLRVWVLRQPGWVVARRDDFIRTVRFLPDGRGLVASGDRLLYWEAATGRFNPEWGGPAARNVGGFLNDGLAVSPDGRTVAVGQQRVVAQQGVYPTVVRLWDAATAAPRGALPCDGPPNTALAFAPDGRHLAGTFGPLLRVWDLTTRRVIAEHDTGTACQTDLAFTPDGRTLLTVGYDAAARLWDTGAWQVRHTLTFGAGLWTCVAVAPDGLTAAAGSDSGRVVVWDVDG